MRISLLSVSSFMALLVLGSCSLSGNVPAVPSSSSVSSFSSVAQQSSSSHSLISIASPLPNTQVQSPLIVTGRARGTWYFEASFPVRLLDSNGNQLAVTPATAQADWMTEDFVPFSATLTFSPPLTATGTLVLEKDNPSGEPAHADQVRIPVSF